MEKNKLDEFYDWIVGEGEFPFFKDIPEVNSPEEKEEKTFWNGMTEKEAEEFSRYVINIKNIKSV